MSMSGMMPACCAAPRTERGSSSLLFQLVCRIQSALLPLVLWPLSTRTIYSPLQQHSDLTSPPRRSSRPWPSLLRDRNVPKTCTLMWPGPPRAVTHADESSLPAGGCLTHHLAPGAGSRCPTNATRCPNSLTSTAVARRTSSRSSMPTHGELATSVTMIACFALDPSVV
jgi:hypothetical protein